MADLSQWIINTPDLSAPGVAEFLANIRQYDPNATYVLRQDMGGEGNLIGSPYYHLSYDASKLPGADGTGILGSGSSNTSISDRGNEYQGPNWQTLNDTNRERVLDPSQVTHSSIYGDVTSNSNIAPLDPKSWLDYGPLIVGAFGFGLGGIPGLTEGFGSQFATGTAGEASGAAGGAFVDPWDVMGDPSAYGLGSGSSFGMYDRSLGMADGTSLYDTQPAAPIVDNSTPARVGDVLRNGGIPGLDNIGQSLSELSLGDLGNLGKFSGLLNGESTGIGIGGGGGGMPQGFGQAESATSILRKWYADDPEIRGLLQQKGLL